jgi:hypothetical protein
VKEKRKEKESVEANKHSFFQYLWKVKNIFLNFLSKQSEKTRDSIFHYFSLI